MPESTTAVTMRASSANAQAKRSRPISFHEDTFRAKPSSSGMAQTTRASASTTAFGSTHSLPAYSSLSKKEAKKLKRSTSTPPSQWPVYMDDKVMKQVRENTSKFIQQRITNVEKHFGDMCQGLGNYLRRLSKFRDAGDELSKYMMTYAEKETFNSSTKEALVRFAANLAAVQDFRDSEVQRIDNKVLGPLTQYGTECKHAKEKLRQAFQARNKELKEHKNLNKAKASPQDKKNLSHAESDLHKASVDATRATKQLETEMEAFEKRKLDDVKKIFLDFVTVEMIFHARALEMYTQCYQDLTEISEDTDLEEFRSSLRPPSVQSRLASQRTGSKTSLNTTGGMSGARSTPATTPSGARRKLVTSDGTPNDTLNTTNKSSMYSQSQYDDEDDDEDDLEDDDDDDLEDDLEDDDSDTNYPAAAPGRVK